MGWATDDLDTADLDNQGDTPPRAMFEKLVTRTKEIIAGRATANGVCDLDGDTLIPLSRVPSTVRRAADSEKTIAQCGFLGSEPTTRFDGEFGVSGSGRTIAGNTNGDFTIILSTVWADTDTARRKIYPHVGIISPGSNPLHVFSAAQVGTNGIRIRIADKNGNPSDPQEIQLTVGSRL
ncbi:MAG: hypothetical protein AAF542_17805 [Pseudomonadota bacterium]